MTEENSPQSVPDFTCFGNHVPPKQELSTEQKICLEELTSLVQAELKEELKEPFAGKYEQPDLLRYLKANKWNVKNSFEAIKSTIKWRKDYDIKSILSGDYVAEGATGKLFFSGFNKENRPIVYMYLTRQNTDDSDMHIKLVVYTLEAMLKILPPGVEQALIIFDLRGYGLKHFSPISETREFLSVLQNHYPERLYKVILLEASWGFSSFFKLASPFIDPLTRQKIVFSSLSKKDDNHISNFISDKYLPKDLGGSYDYVFNSEKFYNSTKKLFQIENN